MISLEHTFGDIWEKDAACHWHECACGEKGNVAAHIAEDWIIDIPATEMTAGKKHKECDVCHAAFASEMIPATGKSDDVMVNDGKNATSIPEVGTKIKDKDNKAVYKVTNVDAKNPTVEYMAPVSKTVKTVTIPASIMMDGITYKVTSIAKNTFKNNKKITKVSIGSNIKTIGDNAFYGCNRLKTVIIGKNVTTIGNKVFYKCTALTAISIPSKVTKIGKQAFYGCMRLTKITIKTKNLTDKKVGKQSFKNIYAKAKIKVPKSKKKAYKTMLGKKGIGSKVKVY